MNEYSKYAVSEKKLFPPKYLATILDRPIYQIHSKSKQINQKFGTVPTPLKAADTQIMFLALRFSNKNDIKFFC